MSRENFHVLNGKAVNIGPGGSATIQIQTPKDADFIIDQIEPRVQLTSAYSGAVAGTTLPRVGSPTAANNTLPSMDVVTLDFSTNNDQWNNAVPTPAGSFVSESTPFLMTKPRLVRAGTFVCKVTNTSGLVGLNLDLTLTLKGKKVS